jgi:hypothetical protein
MAFAAPPKVPLAMCQIDVEIYSVSAASIPKTRPGIEFITGGPQGSVPDRVDIGDLRLEIGDELSWNGEAEPPPGSGVELVAAPRVGTLVGREAKVSMTEGPAEFFESSEGGCYRLATLKPEGSPGLYIAMTPQAVADHSSDAIDLDFSLRVVTITSRQPLPGVGLDVGRPVIGTQELTSRFRLTQGRWSLLSGHRVSDLANPEGDYLLVLVRPTVRVPPRR